MKILQVLHFFLPRHSAGTEVYTDSIARSLRDRGHQIEFFFSEKILSEPNYSLLRREHEGMPCHVLINNLLYESFEETFVNKAVEQAFEAVLDQVRPDLVFFQHLMLLSVRLPSIAASRGIRTVMTLHDFWLYCPRFGQLMERGESVCDGPRPQKCADCISDFKFAQTGLQKKVISAIRWTREVAGFDLAPVVDAVRGSRLAGATRYLPKRTRKNDRQRLPEPELTEQFESREEAVSAMLPSVELFLSPSRTVRDRVVSFGLPENQIEVVPLGIQDIDLPAPRAALEGRDPIFGFIGTLSPHKGAHVVVESMRYLKGRGELLVYGRSDYYPWYASSLRSLSQKLPIRFVGAVPRSRIGEAFGSIDVLVMPSVWLENFPIIIQEARAAGVPVVASDIGGMAEAVRDGVDGFLFKAGDPIELARKLARFVHEPELVAEMVGNARPPITLYAHVDRVEERLRTLLESRRPAP